MYKKEIERKFLINPVLFYNYREQTAYDAYLIEQTYYENPQFRIRRKTLLGNSEARGEFFFTIKLGNGLERREYEEKISWEMGTYLLYSQSKKLEKHRFVIHGGWEVDHFLNSQYNELWIAEKELDGIDQIVFLPNFITEEVTDKEEYTNYYLWTNLKV